MTGAVMKRCPQCNLRMEFNDTDRGVTSFICPRWPDCTERAFEGRGFSDLAEQGPMRFSERRYRDFGDGMRNYGVNE